MLGVALNLDVHEIGAVILGDYADIEEGQQVKRTGKILSVPVGDGFLGRVVDPLGKPIDGLGDIEAETQRVLELQAASVMQRQGVSEPLQTGIKAIDAMTPIGRGQRQLIIGDRKTGKTAVCVDTIINQKQNWATGDPKQQVRCIYVAIGQKGSTIAGVRQSLEDAGALEYTTIVAAPASRPGRLQVARPLHRLGASASTGCTRASTSSSCSTTCPSRPRRTARSRCCCAARRAARPTPATSSTCTPGCWSAARSSPTSSAPAR